MLAAQSCNSVSQHAGMKEQYAQSKTAAGLRAQGYSGCDRRRPRGGFRGETTDAPIVPGKLHPGTNAAAVEHGALERQCPHGFGDCHELGDQSRPLRDNRRTLLPSLNARTRKPSCFSSRSQPSPAGTSLANVGWQLIAPSILVHYRAGQQRTLRHLARNNAFHNYVPNAFPRLPGRQLRAFRSVHGNSLLTAPLQFGLARTAGQGSLSHSFVALRAGCYRVGRGVPASAPLARQQPGLAGELARVSPSDNLARQSDTSSHPRRSSPATAIRLSSGGERARFEATLELPLKSKAAPLSSRPPMRFA